MNKLEVNIIPTPKKAVFGEGQCMFGLCVSAKHEAFAKYMRLSKQGGEKTWDELIKEAGFRSPFEKGALKDIAEKMELLVKKLEV